MTQSLITSEAPAAVSGSKLGHLNDLFTVVLRRLLKDDTQAQALIEAGGTLQDRISAVVSELLGKLTNTYMVTVDYAKSLPDMIKAGNYGYANEDITPKRFPIKGDGKVGVEIVLVHFGKDMQSDDVLAELDKLGLRAAVLPELLAFGETHPEVQREFPIIALGSIANVGGERFVPYLGYWNGRRKLALALVREQLGRRLSFRCRAQVARSPGHCVLVCFLGFFFRTPNTVW